MKKSKVYRMGAVLVGLALMGISACSDEEVAVSTEAPAISEPLATDAPSTQAPAASGELEGMKVGIRQGPDISNWLAMVSDYWVSLGNAALVASSYAAEAYDAAIVIALAVEIAETDGAAHANEIVGITTGGTKCTTFADCLSIIDDGGDPDYDGLSGPHEFNGKGEPLQASYAMLEFGTDNRITEASKSNLIVVAAPVSAVVEVGTTTSTRSGNGQLHFGFLLPKTGTLAYFGDIQNAGLVFAINEINAVGGVLGQEVRYIEGDSGDTSTDMASLTADLFISEGVDAIIGAASSGVTLAVIDKITAAGITMFSPANTSPELSDYPDDSLYFRNAASDVLNGTFIANQIIEDANTSAYIMNLDDTYGNGMAIVIKSLLEAANVEVKGMVAYNPSAASFDAEVAAAVAANSDAVILISFAEGSRILRTAVENGIGPRVKNWYGNSGSMGDEMGENFDAGE